MDTKTPVVFMDEVFDRKYIQRKFENMRYLSEAGRTIRKGIDSLFMNLLDETRFFVLDQESSYDENVDRMARALTNQGELDAGFAQRVREPAIYNAIIKAIAEGASRLNDIKMKVGEENSVVSKYLKTLIGLGIVKRKLRLQKNQERKPSICWLITSSVSGIGLCLSI